MTPKIHQTPSPNHSSRGGHDVTGVVIHYTADGPGWNPVKWLCMPDAKASAHFVIGRDGEISQLVALDRSAWHAGTSEMMYKGEMTPNANRFTIGIELQNAGPLVRDAAGDFHWLAGGIKSRWKGAKPQQAELCFDNGKVASGWWESYPQVQMDALAYVLAYIAAEGYEEASQNLVGHEEVAMPLGRKTDPGPLFPWESFQLEPKHRAKARLL